MSLISKFNNIQFELIPREQNKEADKLANYAYTKVIADNPNLEKNQQAWLNKIMELVMIVKVYWTIIAQSLG